VHGIVAPRNFDISQASSRFVLIDVTSEPGQLLPRSTYQRKEISAFLDSPAAIGRRFRILDFRSGRELQVLSDGTFVECGKFDPAPPGEVLHLVLP
jgi:hypothetical protein